MSAPQLPPPPDAPTWDPPPPDAPTWGPPPPAAPADPTIIDRPAWRQGRPGWTLLNVGISFAIAIGGFFAAAILGLTGRTQAQMDNADDGPVAIGTLLVLASSVVGWFLFAYLDWSLGRRWILFGLLVGGSVVIAAILFSVASR